MMRTPLSPPPPLANVPPAERLVFANVTAVSPGLWRKEAVTLEIAAGAVSAIRVPAADNSDDPRFAGCFVLPGLVDCHQHLPRDNALELSGLFALLYLFHGVTTVRDAGDGDGTAVPAARRLIARDALPGPRVVASGPFVARAPLAWPNSVEVRDPVHAAVLVQRAVDLGAQTLKLYDGLTADDIAALSEAGRNRGLPVIGHVPAALDYETAGVAHVQHFHGVPPATTRRGNGLFYRLADWRAVDERRLDLVVQATLDRGIANTPTLVVTEGVLRAQEPEASREAADTRLLPRLYSDVVWSRTSGIRAYRELSADDIAYLRDSLQRKLALVERLHRAGARLHLGTDVQQPYVVPGASLQREMALFVKAGVPLQDVWRLATVEAGRELGIPGLGTLDPGAPADLLVFARDPTTDLSSLGSLRAVVVGGRVLTIDQLKAAVDDQRSHYRRILVDRIAIMSTRRAMRTLGVPR